MMIMFHSCSYACEECTGLTCLFAYLLYIDDSTCNYRHMQEKLLVIKCTQFDGNEKNKFEVKSNQDNLFFLVVSNILC